ncbi:MAG: ABC transporter permease [Rubrivivax sp.]
MVTVGNGATQAVQDQITSLGTNLLQIRPGQRLGSGGGAGAPAFRVADADAIAAQVSGVRAVVPQAQAGAARRCTARATGPPWATAPPTPTSRPATGYAAGRLFEPAGRSARRRLGVRDRRYRAAGACSAPPTRSVNASACAR